MDKKENSIPEWLPPELQTYAQEVIDDTSTDKDSILFKQIAKRLLMRAEMQEVWTFFQKRGKSEAMDLFVTKAISIHADALDIYLPAGQKQRAGKIKSLEDKIHSRFAGIVEVIAEVDKFCGGLRFFKTPMQLELTKIKGTLLKRLEVSQGPSAGRALLIGRPNRAAISTKNIGSKDYIETVLKKGIPDLFEEIFGEPQARLARIVSLVMLGRPIPKDKGDADLLRNQVYSSKRPPRPRRKK